MYLKKKTNKQLNNRSRWIKLEATTLTWRARCRCWPWRRTSPGYRCPWWRCSGWRQTFQRKCDQDAARREEEKHQAGRKSTVGSASFSQSLYQLVKTEKICCREHVVHQHQSCSLCRIWNWLMFSCNCNTTQFSSKHLLIKNLPAWTHKSHCLSFIDRMNANNVNFSFKRSLAILTVSLKKT